jgi:predicted DNA-binding helix-hairpin-helix protein
MAQEPKSVCIEIRTFVSYTCSMHTLIKQTPFENLTSTNPLREFRLYQASFLLRDYGWSISDLDFLQDGNMPMEVDPKRAWAERHLRQSPPNILLKSSQVYDSPMHRIQRGSMLSTG